MKKVDEAGWVSILTRPQTTVETSMSGLPFLFVPWKNWDTKEKNLTQHLVYYVLAGHFHCVVEGRKFVLRAGELCWVNPGVRFRFYSDPSVPTTVQRFRLRVGHGRSGLRLHWDHRVFPNAGEAMEWARSLVAEPRAGDQFARQRMANLAALFSISVFGTHRTTYPAAALSRTICRRISSYVLDHVEERITPTALAHLVGLTPDYFSRLFRKTFGLPPKEWLLKQRLRHAAGLLAESDWRISEISSRLGYSDLYLFSRQFKKEFGESPRNWRARQLN